jgi:hypothetical protein
MASLNHNFFLSERDIFLRGELDSSGKTGGVFCLSRGTATPTSSLDYCRSPEFGLTCRQVAIAICESSV